jgi:hypothetical protein
MARPDLTNEQIEAMSLQQPGSAREYLRLRDEELAREAAEQREAEAYERFEKVFVEAGGEKGAAKAAYRAHKNELATREALAADERALAESRRRLGHVL